MHARKVSVKELCSLTCLNIDDVMLAVGWLAKENSSFIEKKADSFYVSDGSEYYFCFG
ncbi:winged helix-turn-helix domain-containing protein [Bacteroides fragilis]|nr:winged helix-turn-helix domain-containing protein [Bacteroides fragilis]